MRVKPNVDLRRLVTKKEENMTVKIVCWQPLSSRIELDTTRAWDILFHIWPELYPKTLDLNSPIDQSASEHQQIFLQTPSVYPPNERCCQDDKTSVSHTQGFFYISRDSMGKKRRTREQQKLGYHSTSHWPIYVLTNCPLCLGSDQISYLVLKIQHKHKPCSALSVTIKGYARYYWFHIRSRKERSPR